MEDGVVNISELKTGQKVTVDICNHEVVLTKLDEPRKFTMEDWYPDEVEVYILDDQIEEDEGLHYAFKPMTLEEGMKANEGKFGKNLVMLNFLGRDVEGIEMEEEDEEESED
ncbi:MAG: hypothetical protein H6981_08290 [Gammaproteobacteria bacterium]|nr:hypothetical protein [Gammaproteobacteria bacterium]MCP5136785.1 hypothetical protein [Gammaproteobacteria bacterium]